MDFISHCSSLVDILSFVDHKDFLNSKLVNRAFYHCTQANSRQMPRKVVELWIAIYTQESLSYLQFAWDDISINVTEETTLLFSCYPFIKDYYKRSGTLQCAISASEEEKIKSILEFRSGDERASCILYRNEGYEAEFRNILSIVFGRYHFKSIYIADVDTAAMRKIFADEFLRNRCHCDYVYAALSVTIGITNVVNEADLKELGNLVKTLDCRSIDVLPHWDSENYTNDIKEATTWNTSLRLELRIHHLTELLDVFKNWESGHISLNKVKLISTARLSGSCWWYNEKLDIILKTLEQVTRVQVKDATVANFKRSFRIGRRCDNKMLLLTSCYQKEYPYDRRISAKEQ